MFLPCLLVKLQPTLESRQAQIEVGIQNCGIVTGISITYGGGGYLSPPTVTISNDTGEKNYSGEVVGVNTTDAFGVVSTGQER